MEIDMGNKAVQPKPVVPEPKPAGTPQPLAQPPLLTMDQIKELIARGQLVLPVTQPSLPAQPAQPAEVAQPAIPEVPAPAQIPELPPQPAQLAVPKQPKEQPESKAEVPQPAQPEVAQPKESKQPLAPEVPAQPPQPGAPQQSELPKEPVVQKPQPLQPTDAELQAMGWGARPQPSPARVADGNVETQVKDSEVLKGDEDKKLESAPAGLNSQKLQQFNQTPKVPAAVKVVTVQQAPNAQTKEQQQYSRRAAANLIGRLHKNPGRLEGLPDLKKLVFDGARKSELISLLCEQEGNLEQVNGKLQVMEEAGRVNIARKTAVRYTKKQMCDIYGDDAARVMKHKEDMGMVEEDENNSGGQVYLVAKKEDEEEDFQRSCSLFSSDGVWEEKL